MPVRRFAWSFAWWLMRRVVLGWMTPQGQARQINQALGWYRPPTRPGGLYDRWPDGEFEYAGIRITTGPSNTTTISDVRWSEQ